MMEWIDISNLGEHVNKSNTLCLLYNKKYNCPEIAKVGIYNTIIGAVIFKNYELKEEFSHFMIIENPVINN